MKLEKIKAKLASLLLTFGTIKTDKAVLEYEGEELEVGAKVYVVDEEGNKVAAADGDYTTEDNKKIVVANGEIAEIADVTEEPTEEEKPTEEVEAAEEEETKEEEKPTEEETDKVAELEKKVAELESIIEGILEKIEKDNTNVEARLSKVEKMSASKTIEEEFEVTTKTSKTGNSKVDKFIERYGK
jgi:outer membrane biosynthesis protein TonB